MRTSFRVLDFPERYALQTTFSWFYVKISPSSSGHCGYASDRVSPIRARLLARDDSLWLPDGKKDLVSKVGVKKNS
jgi:hypothetical protein